MTDTTRLLIIDPQNDFCDIPPDLRPLQGDTDMSRLAPALPVTGAHDDMLRLADFIRNHGALLDEIQVTLDSHHAFDIAHAPWWRDLNGRVPAPFTVITREEVMAGKWLAHIPARQEVTEQYVAQLEASGRYPLVIWPTHCLVGSWGHNIHRAVFDELKDWSLRYGKAVDYVFKGLNPSTEHYSAVRAEVPDPADPATETNRRMVEAVASSDLTLVAGEALSHCVANTVRDIADSHPDAVSKMLLLSDCASPVPGFEQQGQDFVTEMTQRGMRAAASTLIFK